MMMIGQASKENQSAQAGQARDVVQHRQFMDVLVQWCCLALNA
jgi:hypothetical protein